MYYNYNILKDTPMELRNKWTIIVTFLLLTNVYGSEDSLYNFNWLDDDETVYVIQNKEYPTEGRVEFNLALSDSDHTPYQSSIAYTGGLAYYVTETFSFDIMYRSYANSNNNEFESLTGTTEKKPLLRIVDTSTFFHLNYLPFYGKINTLNKIFYFYWGIGIGVGQFDTRANYPTFTDPNKPVTYISESIVGYNTKTYFKFFLAKNWNFGLELDIFYFNAIADAEGNEDLTIYNDISLNFGYLF